MLQFTPTFEERVLVLAPSGKDARLSAKTLGRFGIATLAVDSLEQLIEEQDRGVGALLIAEEALTDNELARLVGVVARQPSWSDIAVLILARRGANSIDLARAAEALGNLLIIERPASAAALVTTVRAALRARARQYELRAQLAATEKHAQVLAQMVDERTTALRELSHHLLEITELEKRALARELHDELGSQLTVIGMDLGSLKRKMAGRAPDLIIDIDQTMELVKSTAEIKRRIMEGLRPSSLDSMGLGEAVRVLVGNFAQRTGIDCKFSAHGAFNDLDPKVTIALYRIAQESLTNVAKYANATAVDAVIERAANHVRLVMTDNGVGIERSSLVKPGSHGIAGMRERVAYFGGTFSLEDNPNGRGTMVEVRVPLRASTEIARPRRRDD